MKLRSWVFLLVGFGSLLVLIGLSSTAMYTRMEQVRRAVQALQQANEETTQVLEDLRSEIYLFAILLRDYLLERSPESASEQRKVLDKLRISTQDHVQTLLRQPALKGRPEVLRLQQTVEEYWRSAEPVFQWTAAQKALAGPPFLRLRMAPQRQAAFQLAAEIEAIGMSQSRLRQQEILRTQEELRAYLSRVATIALLLGAAVSIISIARTRSLELGAARHVHLIERGAEDLRRLSQKLSKAQEEERKSISRELHDQVGQMLTALRIALANIEESRHSDGSEFERHLNDARKLSEETLRTIRDISMGLRPSVLDELGLAPALKWQAREFTRRSGVPVDIQIDGELEKLNDKYRTCLYRVVQEALTNCARHARASHIRIAVHGGVASISATVEDDGVGFQIDGARARGLGILGAEERVRELGGRLDIFSQPAKGTLVRCDIPRSREAEP